MELIVLHKVNLKVQSKHNYPALFDIVFKHHMCMSQAAQN